MARRISSAYSLAGDGCRSNGDVGPTVGGLKAWSEVGQSVARQSPRTPFGSHHSRRDAHPRNCLRYARSSKGPRQRFARRSRRHRHREGPAPLLPHSLRRLVKWPGSRCRLPPLPRPPIRIPQSQAERLTIGRRGLEQLLCGPGSPAEPNSHGAFLPPANRARSNGTINKQGLSGVPSRVVRPHRPTSRMRQLLTFAVTDLKRTYFLYLVLAASRYGILVGRWCSPWSE